MGKNKKKPLKKQTFDVCLEIGQTRSWRFPNYVCDTNMCFFFFLPRWVNCWWLEYQEGIISYPPTTPSGCTDSFFLFFFLFFLLPFHLVSLRSGAQKFSLISHSVSARTAREPDRAVSSSRRPPLYYTSQSALSLPPRTSSIVFRSPHKTTSGTDSVSSGGTCLCARVSSKANQRACWC